VTLFRAVAPYTQFLLVLVSLYVVWALVTGFIGYMSRFLRFAFRIGPVIAIIAWIMAASGQGGIDVIFEALKQYAGLAPADNGYPRGVPPRRTPGWDTPGAGSTYRRRRGSESDSSSYWDSRRAQNANGRAGSYRSATRGNQNHNNNNNNNGQGADAYTAMFEDGFGASVQSFVRQALARAAGLEWLVKVDQPDKDKKQTRSR
jgi:hypothetical protein